MPTILRSGAFRFFFYVGDRDEPPHFHVERGEGIAKYWLNPVRLEDSKGFKDRRINYCRKSIDEVYSKREGIAKTRKSEIAK
ncbi:MAG: DUF4160 domain-containing protein [Pirellulales bacterium]|nr:DUF4160 domain-containing protein [Pirellulales bacterium]